jgi:hypothetical protein
MYIPPSELTVGTQYKYNNVDTLLGLMLWWPWITVYQYSDRGSQYISIVTVDHSISVEWNQRDALFIQFIKN